MDEDLKAALLVIKQECSKHQNCMDCCLCDKERWICLVANDIDGPEKWKFV